MPTGEPLATSRTGPAARMPAASREQTLAWAAAALGVTIGCVAFRDYLVDDAYIGLRYIDNLLRGHGLVFNPGERVEGVTNIGWLLLLVPFSAVLGPVLAAKAVGAALLLATAGLAGALAGRLAGPTPGMALMGVLLVLTRFEVSYFSLAGMETALAALLMLLVVRLALDDRRPILVAVLCAFAFLVRPETILVLPVAAAFLLGRGVVRRRYVAAATVFAALIAAVTLARLFYFGDVLPNTFRAKPSDLPGTLAALVLAAPRAGANFVFPFGNPLVLAVLGAGAWALRGRSAAAAFAAGAVLAGGAVALYAEPDWTGLGRYFAPYAPVAIVLLLAGCVRLEERFAGDGTRKVGTAIAGSVLILLGAVDMFHQGGAQRLQTFPGYVMAGRSLVAPARAIGESLPSGALIATRRIGAIAFYGDRPVLDYSLGLTDRRVAELVHETGRIWSPADERLATIWRDRPPDAVVEDSDVIDRLLDQVGGTRELFRLHGVPYRVTARFPLGRRVVAGLFGPETHEIAWELAQRITQP